MMDNMVVPSFHESTVENENRTDIENSIINALQTNNQELQRERHYNFPYCIIFILSTYSIAISIIVCYVLIKIF